MRRGASGAGAPESCTLPYCVGSDFDDASGQWRSGVGGASVTASPARPSPSSRSANHVIMLAMVCTKNGHVATHLLPYGMVQDMILNAQQSAL